MYTYIYIFFPKDGEKVKMKVIGIFLSRRNEQKPGTLIIDGMFRN